MKCLVLDYGGSSVKYAVVDDSAVMTRNGSAAAPLSSLEEFLDSVAALYEGVKEEVDGIAMSLPGFIDPETGMHFGSGVYLSLIHI